MRALYVCIISVTRLTSGALAAIPSIMPLSAITIAGFVPVTPFAYYSVIAAILPGSYFVPLCFPIVRPGINPPFSPTTTTMPAIFVIATPFITVTVTEHSATLVVLCKLVTFSER